jgi:hypothetical protein
MRMWPCTRRAQYEFFGFLSIPSCGCTHLKGAITPRSRLITFPKNRWPMSQHPLPIEHSARRRASLIESSLRVRENHHADSVALVRPMVSLSVPAAAPLEATTSAVVLAESPNQQAETSTTCATQTSVGPRGDHSSKSIAAARRLPHDRAYLQSAVSGSTADDGEQDGN